MGYSTSKLDGDKQMPVNSQSFRLKIEKIKQRRRVRRASIVLKRELLSDCEGGADNSVKKAVEEIVMVVIEKKKEAMNGAIIKRDEREAEFPGSPSFRVYCMEVASTKEPENDPIKVIEKIKEEKLAQEKERILVQTHGRENSCDSLISNEDSVRKPQKKEKGRRFRALTKAPSRVYSYLSVKNCYGPSSTTDTAPDDCPHPRHHSVNSA